MVQVANRSFKEFISRTDIILAEGSIVERVNRDSSIDLDPYLGYSSLMYDTYGRAVLETLYREYLDIGYTYGIPFLGLAPTWRANPERAEQSVCGDFKKINADCVTFYRNIIESYGDYAGQVFLGGLMACRGDAYRPEEALDEKEAAAFHRPQAEALAAAGVDFIKVATLPAFTEAAGMAQMLSSLETEYILSFVLQKDGTLLDGTPLAECINSIDGSVEIPPVCYMVNCIHPAVLIQAAEVLQAVSDRMQGIQANTSRLTPDELDNLEYLDEEDPDVYSEYLLQARDSLNLKIIGGCCGTDERHIEAVAGKLNGLRQVSGPDTVQ